MKEKIMRPPTKISRAVSRRIYRITWVNVPPFGNTCLVPELFLRHGSCCGIISATHILLRTYFCNTGLVADFFATSAFLYFLQLRFCCIFFCNWGLSAEIIRKKSFVVKRGPVIEYCNTAYVSEHSSCCKSEFIDDMRDASHAGKATDAA